MKKLMLVIFLLTAVNLYPREAQELNVQVGIGSLFMLVGIIQGVAFSMLPVSNAYDRGVNNNASLISIFVGTIGLVLVIEAIIEYNS
jgi:hydrogenase-4 membrane subunit HyfE